MPTPKPDEPACPASAPVPGSAPTPLYVSARVYNQPGIYRVLEIGIEDGHKNNNYDVAKLLRKLADWVENKKAQNDRVELRRPANE